MAEGNVEPGSITGGQTAPHTRPNYHGVGTRKRRSFVILTGGLSLFATSPGFYFYRRWRDYSSWPFRVRAWPWAYHPFAAMRPRSGSGKLDFWVPFSPSR